MDRQEWIDHQQAVRVETLLGQCSHRSASRRRFSRHGLAMRRMRTLRAALSLRRSHRKYLVETGTDEGARTVRPVPGTEGRASTCRGQAELRALYCHMPLFEGK